MMVDFMGGPKGMRVAHDPVRKVCGLSGSCVASAAPTYHAAPIDEFTPKAQIRPWLTGFYRRDAQCRTLPSSLGYPWTRHIMIAPGHDRAFWKPE